MWKISSCISSRLKSLVCLKDNLRCLSFNFLLWIWLCPTRNFQVGTGCWLSCPVHQQGSTNQWNVALADNIGVRMNEDTILIRTQCIIAIALPYWLIPWCCANTILNSCLVELSKSYFPALSLASDFSHEGHQRLYSFHRSICSQIFSL